MDRKKEKYILWDSWSTMVDFYLKWERSIFIFITIDNIYWGFIFFPDVCISTLHLSITISYNNSMKKIIWWFPFYRWENWGTEGSHCQWGATKDLNSTSEWFLHLKGSAEEMILKKIHTHIWRRRSREMKGVYRQFQACGLWPKRSQVVCFCFQFMDNLSIWHQKWA